MYEIFFVNLWVIILYQFFVHYLKPQVARSCRRETALQDGLVMVKSGRLELGGNIYGKSIQPL